MPYKHAYLVLAHNEWGLLKKLINLLDYEENEIFLHVDKSSRGFDPAEFVGFTKHTSVHIIERIAVSHGGVSMVKATLNLLRAACKTPHDYYHLISGSDLPIKSHLQIIEYFEEHKGKEFVSVDGDLDTYAYRLRYYHFWADIPLHRDSVSYNILRFMSLCNIKVQAVLGINRIKNCKTEFKKGGEWFSISHALALYVLAQELPLSGYKYCYAADETFLQTLVMASPFADKVATELPRLTDWTRGNPYTFRVEDYDMLINSDAMYARKFSETVDAEIVQKIYDTFRRDV